MTEDPIKDARAFILENEGEIGTVDELAAWFARYAAHVTASKDAEIERVTHGHTMLLMRKNSEIARLREMMTEGSWESYESEIAWKRRAEKAETRLAKLEAVAEAAKQFVAACPDDDGMNATLNGLDPEDAEPEFQDLQRRLAALDGEKADG